MIITQTPLRISLVGGNTDFRSYFQKYGGACITLAIDKYVYCIVKERFDSQIRINYTKKEIVSKVEDIKHDLVREAMKLVGVEKGIEITFLSDIPAEGSGLASSSAVTVGLLNALHRYKGESVGAKQLAEEACRIEIDILKKPIGVQDQYAVAFGGARFLKMHKKIEPLRLSAVDTRYFMLMYTGITRKAEKVLSRMKLNKKILDLNKELAYYALDHIVDPYSLGHTLGRYWELKKKLNRFVSNSKIDRAYKKALKLGALGGKIIGAGGGGFLLLLVDPSDRNNIKYNLGLEELPFNISRDGSKVIFDIRK